QDARVEGGRQTSETRAVDVIILGAHREVGMVESVERLGAEFEVPGLLDLRALDQAQVDVPEAGAADRSQLQSSVLSGVRILQNLRVPAPVGTYQRRVNEKRTSRHRIEEQPGPIL